EVTPKSLDPVVSLRTKPRVSAPPRRNSRRSHPGVNKRSAIALGTSARVLKHNRLLKSCEPLAADDDAIESTQPMETLCTQPMVDVESADQLFTMTQTPLPIEATSDTLEFPDLSHKRHRGKPATKPMPPMQRAASETVSMRKPPTEDEGETLSSRRSSKLSFSSLKGHSFLRGLGFGRRRHRSQSEESTESSTSSCIPPLRDRLSAASATTPKRKKRKTNDLYSPWLRGSRFRFLKKYRIGSGSRRSRASLPPSRLFSPGWSRIKGISADFGRQSKTQLLIRSTKKRVPGESGLKRRPINPDPPKSGPVCPFFLPLKRLGHKSTQEMCTSFVLCSQCGCRATVFSASEKPFSMPAPCPIVHDKEAYWPESGRELPPCSADRSKRLEFSPAPTSVVTIQPSYIPQSFSMNTVQLGNDEESIAAETNNAEPLSCSTQMALSSVNIQPSFVPQSFSVNTFTSKTETQVEVRSEAEFDHQVSSGDKSGQSKMAVAADPLSLSISLRDTPQTPLPQIGAPIVPETPIQPEVTPLGPVTSPSPVDTETRDDLAGCKLISKFELENISRECADLEEEVTRLQQELEDEALDPDQIQELLANAGTETEQVEDEVISASPVPENVDASPGLPATQTPRPCDSAAHSAELNKLDMVSDANAMEDALDVIPSSQCDEEMEPSTPPPPPPESPQSNEEPEDEHEATRAADIVPAPQTSDEAPTAVTRVENSQSQSVAASEVLSMSMKPSDTTAADTMPFTQPPETHQQQVTSFIADTENLVASMKQEDEATAPTIFITGSNLSSEESNSLRRFCSQFNAVEDPRFVPNRTTHVVMATEAARPRVTQRTLKYFMGILHGAWVINTQWLRKCLLANTLLCEEPFEIQGDTVCGDCHEGPRRGRLRVPAIPPIARPLQPLGENTQSSVGTSADRRPFVGLMLCAFGEIGPLTTEEFTTLVRAGGGTALAEPKHFLTLAGGSPPSAKPKGLKCMILTSSASPKFNLDRCIDLYTRHNVPIININWLLNSASVYRRLPLSKVYVIYPVD
uniref:RING-type domain-containing protein n=2 Tax=Mesocestoides corti TaxID=53468 RepID=A0A5K3F8C7_MESCO